MCKKSFTKLEVILALNKAELSALKNKNSSRQERRFYWCKDCKSYHLTSKI